MLVGCGRIGFGPTGVGPTGDGRIDGVDGTVSQGMGTYRVGNFTKSPAVGGQTVAHGLGEVPKALVVWTAGTGAPNVVVDVAFSVGISDGTDSRYVSGASQNATSVSNASRRGAPALIGLVSPGGMLRAEARVVSFDASNFTLDWTTNDAEATTISFLVIGGASVQAKVLDWQTPVGPAIVPVTGVGFQPDLLIHVHGGLGITSIPLDGRGAKCGLGVMVGDGSQWALETLSSDLRTTSFTSRQQVTDAGFVAVDEALTLVKRAKLIGMTPDGFNVDVDLATDPQQGLVFTLALAGIGAHAGSFIKPTASASQPIAGVPFQPGVILLASFQDVPSSVPVGGARFGIGAATATSGSAFAYEDLHNVGVTTVMSIDMGSIAFVALDTGDFVIDALASVTSFDPTGFTLQWTTNDGLANQMLYLALR